MRSRRGLVVVVAGLVVVGATSAAVVRHHAWYPGWANPFQRIVSGHPTLAARIHAAQSPPFRPIGPLVASLGSHGGPVWAERLYITTTDVPPGHALFELQQAYDTAHRTLPGGTVLPAAVNFGFYDTTKVIWAVTDVGREDLSGSPLPTTLIGHLDRKRAATLDLRSGPSRRPIPIRVRSNGYFMQRLSGSELAAIVAHRARLVARDHAGLVVARTTLNSPLTARPPSS